MQDKLPAAPKRRQINLNEVSPGKKVRVVELPQGRHSVGQLVKLGIGPGVELEVMKSHPFRGPVVIRLDGNPVAIGHGLAKRITVEEY
ncbi:MAG: FeoA family protein [Bacillota bacterium]